MADIELASRLAGGMLGLLVDEPSVMIVEPGSVTSVTNPTRLPAPSSGTSLMRAGPATRLGARPRRPQEPRSNPCGFDPPGSGP